MEEKICCFRCKFKFCVDKDATKIVCPRCGSGFDRALMLEKSKEPVEDIVLEAVDDIVVDSVVEDKPGRRGKKSKYSFDAVPSPDEPMED
jgi:DNA-directed RNA polymerase subunit RPC12/RpoP